MEALGSYRRKQPIVHDIDLFTTGNLADADREFRNSADVLGKFADGDRRTAYIVRFEGKNIKVDIFRAPEDERAAAVLHWTGSVQWNIRCRAAAKRRGYKLNEKGLFTVRTGKRVNAPTEEDILKIIGVTWRPPEER